MAFHTRVLVGVLDASLPIQPLVINLRRQKMAQVDDATHMEDLVEALGYWFQPAPVPVIAVVWGTS